MYKDNNKYNGVDVGTGVAMIGNIRAEDAEIACQAAKNSGIPVQISNITMDVEGRQMYGYVALWAPANVECGPFWKEYRELEAKQ